MPSRFISSQKPFHHGDTEARRKARKTAACDIPLFNPRKELWAAEKADSGAIKSNLDSEVETANPSLAFLRASVSPW